MRDQKADGKFDEFLKQCFPDVANYALARYRGDLILLVRSIKIKHVECDQDAGILD